MTAPRSWRAVATHPTVLLVVGGLALYPFVRERPEPRVLRLTEEQALRTLQAERTRSDAPETRDSQRRALERALEEEALAEFAIAEGLHRHDDALRRALADAARSRIAVTSSSTPTDDELHALLSEAPIEDLVDAEVGDLAEGATARFMGLTLTALEATLGVVHLPMPTRDDPVTATVRVDGGSRSITLRVHPETEAERIARTRPELERRFQGRNAAATERSVLDTLLERYDRVERP